MSEIKSVNPYTGELLKSYPSLNEPGIREKLELSDQTYNNWKNTSFSERAELMSNAGKQLLKEKQKYANIISLEMGKVIKESVAEVEKCAWVCEYYSKNASEFLQDEPIELPDGKKAKLSHEPIGAVLAVMPWNFPFWQVFRFAAPTLMAGNTGLLKHASNVPQCSLAIEEVFERAGFPKGVFQSLLIDSKATTQVISNPIIKAVTLTGSEKAGASVASEAAKNIKKAVLELGGSDPFIVLKDADIDLAAETAVKARMINNGQSCIAAKRFIIEQDVYSKFVELFSGKLKELNQGDPLDEKSDYACMARADLASELYDQVKTSVEKGAKVLVGGVKPEDGKALFTPTVLTDISSNSPAYSEELFGPVATLFSVKNEEEAIKLANDSEFGLGSSIWTKDLKKGELLASKIESGAVFINSMVASNPHLPFGGIKKSGFGRELGRYGILEFVNTKTVYLG
ncbi:NAD-dependent succinate-semialdehyde dehydrogenase [Algoriphagus halophilus]|uniref:Succinate-semialdehyde dehydrogenase / glutarate-semialdehyde dehydrogenase n=1 Tax=Algoriphagus halophilus TaxID=226505 RepID=A0A1N6HBT6_9BACT|nr:NAD-dependent succinate-semialdehyde dehydrogenase [Algoriphagus halophilus]SIO17284.1 succinate-semialdehyde dehydrogenase / glutarate-semialdehyde dehydrogenase [Algoriphagus halophilus]